MTATIITDIAMGTAIFFTFILFSFVFVMRELLAQITGFLQPVYVYVVRCSIPHIRGEAYMENTATRILHYHPRGDVDFTVHVGFMGLFRPYLHAC
jgi:hypothetical protein